MATVSDIYLTTESELTSLRSSFRNLLDKAGVSASTSYTFPDGVITALNNIPTIKVDSSYGDIVGYSASISGISIMNDSAITFISYPKATLVVADALKSCPKLKKLILTCSSSTVNIGASACMGLSQLVSVSITNCGTIAEQAFQNCTALYEVLIPSCTRIGHSAFQSCSTLSRLDAPQATFVGNFAFDGCSNLSQVTLDKCTEIGAAAFQNCSNLETISLSSCTSLGGSFTTQQSSIFAGCTKLSSVSIPQALSIYTDTFSGCTNLSMISLPKCTSIYAGAFQGCTKLVSIYLNKSDSTHLVNENAFYNTPMQAGGLSAYDDQGQPVLDENNEPVKIKGIFYAPDTLSARSYYPAQGPWQNIYNAGQFSFINMN